MENDLQHILSSIVNVISKTNSFEQHITISQCMEKKGYRVAVFCGSATGNRAVYKEAAQELARQLAAHQTGLVYGGGNVGLMGIIADEMLKCGGDVIGVIPEKLMHRELGHKKITELIIVNTMHERKAKMAELSNAFVAMPGGIGTLEEMIEVFTWLQLGYHHKPCALLNTDGYYDPFLTFFEHMITEGFLARETADTLIVKDKPGELIDTIQAEFHREQL